MTRTFAGLAVAVAGIAMMSTAPAHAGVQCKGEFQWIKGTGYHASPYCEIKNLYKVARKSYGISTSFRKLRNIVAEREEVCQAIGHDSRVSSACLPYRLDGGHRKIN
ncbi:MAG: hypothetical protein AAGD43_28155 [Pseudomonadota bacterium]